MSGWRAVQFDRVHSLRPFQNGAGSSSLLEQKTLEDQDIFLFWRWRREEEEGRIVN